MDGPPQHKRNRTMYACTCPQSHKPVEARAWFVVNRKSNRSTFTGGRRVASAYSEVRCGECCAVWRTKAAYVDKLKNW